MLIGETPGREEDLTGKAFAGTAGVLLDNMLKAIGLSREKVYLSYTVPWRPPGNKQPTKQDLALCLPFLKRQIALFEPKVILLMGSLPILHLLKAKHGSLKMHGKWQEFSVEKTTIATLCTFSPNYLLQQPSYKKLAWQDLQKLKQFLDDKA